MKSLFNKCTFIKKHKNNTPRFHKFTLKRGNNSLKQTITILLILFSSIYLFAKPNDFPATVVDGIKQTVTCTKKPTHIISLGAASTEILFEIGAEKQIVAVTDISNYPQEVKKFPSVGGFGPDSISIEKIISHKPDLVIIYKGIEKPFIPTFEKFHIPYYVSDVKTVEDVITEVNNIAILTGHKEKGEQLAKYYNNLIKTVNSSVNSTNSKSQNRPKVYWEIWYEPFMSAGNQSFINDVITIAGGKNIFAELNQAYPIVSEEAIISANPQFILIPNDINILKQTVTSRPAWKNLDAVMNDKIFIFDADIYTRPGPRIFLAIQELHSILYKE